MLERMDAIFLTGQVLKGKSSNFGKNVIITFQRAFLFNATIEQSYTLLYLYIVIHYLFVLLPDVYKRQRHILIPSVVGHLSMPERKYIPADTEQKIEYAQYSN